VVAPRVTKGVTSAPGRRVENQSARYVCGKGEGKGGPFQTERARSSHGKAWGVWGDDLGKGKIVTHTDGVRPENRSHSGGLSWPSGGGIGLGYLTPKVVCQS